MDIEKGELVMTPFWTLWW